MKAMFLGAPELTLTGKVKGKTITINAKMGDMIELSEDQKSLVEKSGTHVLVPGIRPKDRLIMRASADRRTVERIKETITYAEDDDWFLTPIPAPVPPPPAEAVARGRLQHETRLAEVQTEQEAERVKAEAEGKRFKDSVEAARLVKETERPKEPSETDKAREQLRATVKQIAQQHR